MAARARHRHTIFGQEDMGRIVMTDAEFHELAEQVLQAVEAGCDRVTETTDVDIDSRRAGSVVTLVFGNGSQMVVNLQRPLHEIWLAARSGGFHFQHDGQHWMDTRGRGEFFAILTGCAREQTAQTITFSS